MLVEALVGGLLSAFFQLLFDRLSPRTNLFEFLKKYKFSNTHLEKLQLTLVQVSAVLSDAEEKQITNPFVRQWLDELKDAAYDTADLLDEINSLASTKPDGDKRSFYKKIKVSRSRLEEVSLKIEEIAKHKDVLGLSESFSRKVYPRFQSTSLVKEGDIYGREDDKKKILDCLLTADSSSHGNVGDSSSDGNDVPVYPTSNGNDAPVDSNSSENNVPVVAIVGTPGVGKTTLAQLLYNDSKVQSKFDFKAWVYVSEDLDVFKVSKTIYESVTSQSCDITDLNILLVKLKEKLNGKKFLFVLDDMWNENYCDWDVLRNCLAVGDIESRILVTTRNKGVALTMRAVHTCHLGPLGEADCWSVFKNQAFGSPNADASLKLECIGREIMKKCGGLPLAAKVLGSLLYSKVEACEWNRILNSSIWDLPSDKSNILPSLRLSYYNLPSHLKPCFAYCSMFPKNHKFDKEKLVLLWMAEGFVLKPQNDQSMKEVGMEYFDELLSRSFFQLAGDHQKTHFVMHDLMNELARFASTEFCFLFEGGKSVDISKKARHFSFVLEDHPHDGSSIRNTLMRTKILRTFLPLLGSNSGGIQSIDNTTVNLLLSEQKRLRVLSLSEFRNIHKLPDVFENLLHLRYLDFSRNTFSKLPGSIVKLRNLQTLILWSCEQLIELPADMKKLLNLIHLDLMGTRSLKKMPPAFGELRSLQFLTHFVVSENAGASGLEELGKLLLLRGKLCISELQNVRDGREAEKAKLKDKENLRELEFRWADVNGSNAQETILEKLCPPENLENLSIVGYNGSRLPDWLGGSSVFHMVILQLIDCKTCSCIPPLGSLPSLRELHIKNMPALTIICDDFYGSSSSPFRSLLILKFENLPNWKDWSEGGFPVLKQLHIEKCKRLTEMPNCLPSLLKLILIECSDLCIDDIMGYPKLQDLTIRSCNSLKKITLLGQLKFVEINECRELAAIENSQDHHSSCQELHISDCPNLELFLGSGLAAANLITFSVYNCSKLLSMPIHMATLLPSLQSLIVSGCPGLDSFPGGLPTCLQSLTIKNCVNLTPQHAWGLKETSLSCLTIECAYPNVTSFPDEGLLPHSLTSLQISQFPVLKRLDLKGFRGLKLLKDLQINCSRLQFLSDGRLPQSLHSLNINGCSSLTDRFQNEYRNKISHIQSKIINGKVM